MNTEGYCNLNLNLSLFKWLSISRFDLNFIPAGLHVEGIGQLAFSIEFLKDNKLSALGTCKSSLLYHDIANGTSLIES